jgi:hypothetical protein
VFRDLDEGVAAALAGRATGIEDLPERLIAIDPAGEPARLAYAEELLVRADPRFWLALDVATRRSPYHPPAWTGLAARRLLAGDLSIVGTVVAACHPDGRIREAAIVRLADSQHSIVLAVLAIRAVDWVPQVRERARRALERRLVDSPRACLVVVAPIAFALRARREGSWLAERIERALRDGPPEALEAALVAADRRTRRAAFSAGVAAGRLDRGRLLRAARYDDDVLVRIACAVAVIRTAIEAGRVDDIQPILTNRTSQIRAEAVFALAREGELGPAEVALADRATAVRAVAQAAVRRRGADPAARYRELATETPPNPAALAGLGETGALSDAGLALAWLHHPVPRGRVEAIRAARRLGVSSPSVLLSLLVDPSPAVVREVVSALRLRPGDLDPAALRALMRAPHPVHVRRAAYRLLCECGPWLRLTAHLEVIATDPAERLREHALSDLDRWLAHVAATAYAPPEGEAYAELLALTEVACPRLGTNRQRLLLFHVRPRSR